uniref:Uncharacterized protein n=1 Tax=Anguilla anguilla TaxID=7936 RepID=A0A0E9VLA8_ANGAN
MYPCWILSKCHFIWIAYIYIFTDQVVWCCQFVSTFGKMIF